MRIALFCAPAATLPLARGAGAAYLDIMPLVFLILAGLFLALIFLPQWWVRQAMRQHAQERQDFPGTGGELARHLLDLARLRDVRVEIAPPGGDHYDPIDRVVRLSPDNHDGRSVTAVAVAAHEASHAMQHADGDKLLTTRVRLAGSVRSIEVAAAIILALAPLVAFLVKSPALILLQVGGGDRAAGFARADPCPDAARGDGCEFQPGAADPRERRLSGAR